MSHSHLTDMKIPGTKRFIPKGFELGTTLSQPIWTIVYFPAKLDLKIDTFLTLMGTKPIWVNLTIAKTYF